MAYEEPAPETPPEACTRVINPSNGPNMPCTYGGSSNGGCPLRSACILFPAEGAFCKCCKDEGEATFTDATGAVDILPKCRKEEDPNAFL